MDSLNHRFRAHDNCLFGPCLINQVLFLRLFRFHIGFLQLICSSPYSFLNTSCRRKIVCNTSNFTTLTLRILIKSSQIHTFSSPEQYCSSLAFILKSYQCIRLTHQRTRAFVCRIFVESFLHKYLLVLWTWSTNITTTMYFASYFILMAMTCLVFFPQLFLLLNRMVSYNM